MQNLHPTAIRAGDSYAWDVDLNDYLPSDGWSLSFAFSKEGSLFSTLVQVTAEGETFKASLSSSDSALLVPGLYTVYTIATRTNERKTISEKNVRVSPDALTGHDARSQAERTLHAIRDLLEGKASDDQQMIQYAGRTLSRYTFEQLIAIESRLARTVAREKARKAGHRGFIGARLR